MAGKKEEDSFNLIIGFILIAFVALALIWALSNISSCPENTFSCDNSPCGCCIADANNNSIASCDMGVCPEGTYFFDGMGCCPSYDIQSCLGPYSGCKTIIPCGESFCCGSDACVIQTDGSSKCVPCSTGSLCNPENVNSCCAGFACGIDGTCKKTDSCVGMTCSNYNQPCKICGSDSADCISCSDDSLCVLNTLLGTGTCLSNNDIPLSSCLNNPCTQAGKSCALSLTLPCAEICANVEGELSCQSKGNCPEGYYSCNDPECATGCCSVIDGSCGSCLGNACSIEEEGQPCSLCSGDSCVSCSDTICKSPSCVSTNLNCPPGYFSYEGNCISVQLKGCIPTFCSVEGQPCSLDLEGKVDRCNSICTKQDDGSMKCISPTTPVNDNDFCPEGQVLFEGNCITPTEEEGDDDAGVPDWLLNLKTTCIEECEDCKNIACSEDPYDYDLNGDTYLNAFDLEIFNNYYDTIKPSIEITGDSIYNFNGDNFVDELDYNCILNFCSDGTCRIIGYNETGYCITAHDFNETFTQEQRASISDYDLWFTNVITLENNLDCSGLNSYYKPFCLGLNNEFKDAVFLRNLSYVKLDVDNHGLYYSGCVFMKDPDTGDYVFGMNLESTSCSNEVLFKPSNYFLYRTLANSMVAFDNCVDNTNSKVTYEGVTYEGDCNSYTEDIVDSCMDLALPNGKEDCDKCDSCDYYTSPTCPDTNDCSKYFSEVVLPDGTKNAAMAATMCIACAFNPGSCTTQFNTMCNLCADYNRCVGCKEHYKGSENSNLCNKCTNIGDEILFMCNNRNQPINVDAVFEEYKDELDLCVKNPYIFGSNCIPYLECLKEFPDGEFGCTFISNIPYFKEESGVYTKQLYCAYGNYYYDWYMGSNYILLAENIMKNTGEDRSLGVYNEGMNIIFSGFIDACPGSLTCSLIPTLCTSDGEGGYIPPDGGWEYTIPPNFVDNTIHDANSGMSVGASNAIGSSMAKENIMNGNGGLNSVMNQEGGYGGGGYGG